METRNIRIEFITEMLGTVPKNKDIYSDFILEKAVKKGIEVDHPEELETIQELDEKGFTGFHSDETGLFIYDYLLKGNIKANIGTLINAEQITKIPAYKSHLDRMLHVYPRKLHLENGNGVLREPSGIRQRPLQGMTMQGPRVSLAKSEYVDVGTIFTCELTMLPNKKIKWKVIEKALDYGRYYGLGQWRGSGGFGRYAWAYVE